eukprot:s70_g39.t1
MFQEKLKQLEAKFPIGSRKMHNFVFTGLKISQGADYSITVDQSQYVKDINAIVLSRERRSQPESVVSEDEWQALRAVIGSLQYAAVNTRPDICSRLGWLQSQINKAKVSTLIEANRTLHEAKQHASVALRIQPIPIPDLRFVAFSDASFASEKCPDSHQGMMIMAAHKCIGENERSPINPIVWHSKKIQKVAVSTLSAEAMALAGAVDMLSWVRLFWAWLCDYRCDWRQADETLLRLPPAFSALTPEMPERQPMPEVFNGVVAIATLKQVLASQGKRRSSVWWDRDPSGGLQRCGGHSDSEAGVGFAGQKTQQRVVGQGSEVEVERFTQHVMDVMATKNPNSE